MGFKANWQAECFPASTCYKHAIKTAINILAQNNKKANWVALGALRELNSNAILVKIECLETNTLRFAPSARLDAAALRPRFIAPLTSYPTSIHTQPYSINFVS